MSPVASTLSRDPERSCALITTGVNGQDESCLAEVPRAGSAPFGRLRPRFARSHLVKVGLDYRRYVVENPSAKRRVDLTQLAGDSSLARQTLGWSPPVGVVCSVD